jgi:hypothetical protein
MKSPAFAAAALSLLLASSADALCVYHGKLYAKTTLRQEFHDARWVVLAEVLSAKDNFDENEAWTVYRLRTRRIFKGRPQASLSFFTNRDSGGFYLDRGMTHDIGGTYLLFLNPTDRTDARPHGLRGVVSANYSCGQSKPWPAVTRREALSLERLAAAG